MTTANKESVYLLPNSVITSRNTKLVLLKNPATKSGSCFLLDEEKENLYEVQGFDEKFRSWFLKDRVCSEGCIKMATPYNPVFLVLPYLMEATKNVPLDHLLKDEKFPAMIHLANIVKDLSCIADRKGSPCLNVWCYNEESTLKWLSEKVEKLAAVLQENKERPSQTCAVSSDKDLYRILAFGIISECLDEVLRAKLKTHLGLPEPKKLNDIVKHEPKRPKTEETPLKPLNPPPQKAKPVKLGAKAKALAKSAQGSKSITSFFSVKS